MRYPSEGRAGLTLLEAVLAIVLLSVTVVAFYSGLGLGTTTVSLLEHETQACGLARGLFARVRATGFAHARDEKGDFGPEFAGLSYEVTVRPGRLPNLKNIRVAVRWNEHGFPRELAFDSALADREWREEAR